MHTVEIYTIFNLLNRFCDQIFIDNDSNLHLFSTKYEQIDSKTTLIDDMTIKINHS
jgi:hypothetical protein